jgi:hypothetical protein
MHIHHLVGKDNESTLENIRTAIKEAHRVVRPGGKLIVMESCVAPWFYRIEKALFPLATRLAHRLTGHPATLQYPALMLSEIVSQVFGNPVDKIEIKRGRWILQFGYKYPSALTPARPFRLIVHKR